MQSRETALPASWLPERTVWLNNGVPMPLLGLGTFRLKGDEAVQASLDAALANGYHLVDTAAVYGNEAAIGQALKDLLPRHHLTREDVFLTSKLSPRDHGEEAAYQACLRSLQDLDCSYLDLYLIHWPGTQGRPQDDAGNPERRLRSWRALESLYEAGKLRAIGVSNYTIQHLQELLAHCRVKPTVLQVEFHPELTQAELLEFCTRNGLHLQAYSSLGTGPLVEHATVRAVAQRCSRTPAQVLLRWALCRGASIIPKSASPRRVAENGQLWSWDLSQADMEELNCLDCGKRYCWDPTGVV